MIWRNTGEEYGAVAKSFHWLIALLVIIMLGVGLYMSGLDPSPKMFQIYALHKSVGITILFLVILRLLWRLTNGVPIPLPNHKAWEKILAKIIHSLLYLSLLAMPLSGWIMSSAKGFSVSVFNWFTLPDLVKPDDHLAELAVEFHELVAYSLIGLILLHIAGALKHHLIDRDDTLRRMLPALGRKR